jgi:hypothetical protein
MYSKKGDLLDTNVKVADLAKDKAVFFGMTYAEWCVEMAIFFSHWL